MPSMLRRTAVLLSLLAAACSGSGDTPATAPDIATTTFASSLGIDLTTFTKTATGLYYKDVTVGTGAQVASGQQMTVGYIGWLANGSVFDQNVSFSFPFGSSGFIAGWNQGLGGMRVGGRRVLIIPPALGYGDTARPGIPANSILVFDVSFVAAH